MQMRQRGDRRKAAKRRRLAALIALGACSMAGVGSGVAAWVRVARQNAVWAARPTADVTPKPGRTANETGGNGTRLTGDGGQITNATGGGGAAPGNTSQQGDGEQGDSAKGADPDPALPAGPIPPSAKVVYLTFDDGPDGTNTPMVLKALQAAHVHATFFVIGEQVARNPALLKEEYAEGNSIGNHTYTHNYRYIYASPQNFWQDFEKDEDLIQSILGIRPRIFRCPGGSVPDFTEPYRTMMADKGFVFFDWNVDAGDAEARPASTAEIIHNVETQVMRYNHKGARVVILMHDGPGHINTARAVPSIIAFLKKEGWEFGTLNASVRPIQFRTPPASRDEGTVPEGGEGEASAAAQTPPIGAGNAAAPKDTGHPAQNGTAGASVQNATGTGWSGNNTSGGGAAATNATNATAPANAAAGAGANAAATGPANSL